MVDRLTPAQRSANMRNIKAKNTAPEMAVRRALRELNIRYRLHPDSLPGRPDITIGPRKLALFVHGCFWHRHPSCRYAYTPKTRPEFWVKKFNDNVDRDRRNSERLREIGWSPVEIWECETKDPQALKEKLATVLEQHELTRGAGSVRTAGR